MFGNPLTAPPAADHNNKILWVVKDASGMVPTTDAVPIGPVTADQDLRIIGHLEGTDVTTTVDTGAGAGSFHRGHAPGRVLAPRSVLGRPDRHHRPGMGRPPEAEPRRHPTPECLAEEGHLGQQKVLRDVLLLGHVRDPGQRQHPVLPPGRQQRGRQPQGVGDHDVVVGQAVDQQQRPASSRAARPISELRS